MQRPLIYTKKQIADAFADDMSNEGYSDEHRARTENKKRISEVINTMHENILLATKNPHKIDLLLKLINTNSELFAYALTIGDIESMLPWSWSTSAHADSLQEIVAALEIVGMFNTDGTGIRAANEDQTDAVGNALQKLQEYTRILATAANNSEVSLLPRVILAEDSDFTFGEGVSEELRALKTPGAIKAIGNDHEMRIETPLDIAKYYGYLVSLYGQETDLSHIGLGSNTKAIPINFSFAYAISLLTAEGNIRYFATQIIVPGYLLEFDDKIFNPASPMIWAPENAMGLTMPEIISRSVQEPELLNLVFGTAVENINRALTGDLSGMNEVVEA